MLLKCALLLLFGVFIEAEYSYYQIHSCRLPRIEHGRVRTRQRSRLVKFMCTSRYELVGNRYATCRNGNWDVPPPVCVRPGCHELPTLTNGIQITAHHDAWVINLCHPGYKLKGSMTIFCDGSNWNATAPECVEDTLDKASLSCDFEDENICGWIQDELHDFDWKRLNTKTPSSFQFTGPSYDHTYGKGGGGYFMYIESTSRLENDTARLLSPVYDASVAIDGCFSFYYHMYGKEVGGLRVYQKPDRMQLHDMLNLTESARSNYMLFEAWGNNGDTWFQDVSQLKDFGDGFQIVIEGIRGRSFTSDIAIDDVAILHGQNCTDARTNAVTPPTFQLFSESCVGRCNLTYDMVPLQPGECGCSPSCTLDSKCCMDFVELCVFDIASSADDDFNTTSTVEQPQTQKLISESTTTSTTTTPKPTTTSTTSTTTTQKPTTTKTTTKKVVTYKTTETTKKTPTTTKPPTTPRKPIITTKKLPTTTKKFLTTTKKLSTTTKKLSTTTIKLSTTTKTVPTTQKQFVSNQTTVVDTVDQNKEIVKVQIQKWEDVILPDKANSSVSITSSSASSSKSSSSSSSWKTPLITIVVLALCASLIYLGVLHRGGRGVTLLQRVRGRIAHDSEVRYLNSNDDDGL